MEDGSQKATTGAEEDSWTEVYDFGTLTTLGPTRAQTVRVLGALAGR